MMGTLFTWVATALSLLIVDLLVPGVNIATFPAALIAAVAIGLVNAGVKPTLSLLSMPLNFVSLGTFSLVVNGICFWLASILVPGFSMHGILAFLLAPVVLSFANTFISKYFAERNAGVLTGSSSDLKTQG
ncbi:phage holin family protein [Trichocoleus sp. DQ-A3]|jgi:putative membrane protein|uniref:phage holin family protein n=1 Tax=Cyanophyceae TaxID=3028117 RepID=UPI001689C69D|nr:MULTISPECIES: phage holin family protein [unclassified Coleofasciculus]MBD1890884.1 phage holin family protein [Coleofasciculus sp. FACHB-SPT9]MBD1895132.1 phage holin family protein [Coleofasciculus sp. FACHB-129]MBD1898458.1 phage holin family protein [Coleofasciculus sp. FACHB-125]